MNSDTSKHTALASITATYTDSENEPDSDTEIESRLNETAISQESTPSSSDDRYVNKEKNQVSKLVSYTAEGYEDDEKAHSEDSQDSYFFMQDDSVESKNVVTGVQAYSPVTFHRNLLSLKRHEIQLPVEPPGRCSKSLQEKIAELYSKKKEGKDMNASIQKRKDFRNPSIYEKLITYCNIDERGTNYPPETYDPHSWGPESFYEELAKRQKEEMDRREKEKKERTKVEFMSGTAKKPSTDAGGGENGKRKSKWDVGVSQTSAVPSLKPATLVTPSVLPVATGTKPTVISAFGTITKKVKQ